MDAEDILLRGTGVAAQIPETFFPTELNSPELACSGLDAETSFANLEPLGHSAKRQRTEDEAEEAIFRRLQDEVQRLKGVNQLLQVSCKCIEDKAIQATDDHQKLLTLVQAMRPHKEAFHLHPLDSHRSSIGSNDQSIALQEFVAEEEAVERFLTFDHSPCKSQPGPSETAMTPCKDDRRRAQSARPLNATGSLFPPEKGSGLAARLEEDPRTAHAAAVAAAALVANHGNPAAALLDLLHLATTREKGPGENVFPDTAQDPL